MQSTEVSQRSVARAINRRGKRWGITAKIVGDKVKACDTVRTSVVRGGLGGTIETERVLCTVDDEHPFNGVLHMRVDNGETDLARQFRNSDEAIAKKRAAFVEEYDRETKREWASRRRVTVGSGLHIPAGLAERSRRRGGR